MAAAARALLLGAALLALAAGGGAQSTESAPRPRLPLVFNATVVTISHLVNQSLEYPPWKTVTELRYDFPRRRAWARVLEGIDANATFIRRYDRKYEYKVMADEFPECWRAYLGERMPEPELPGSLELVRGADGLPVEASVLERQCRVWRVADDVTRVTVWQDIATGFALRVTDEGLDDGEMRPLMTTSLEHLSIAADPAEYPLPESAVALPAPWTHKKCDRYAGGFPYLHLFHYYLMI